MSTILGKISRFFMSKEKKFVIFLIEELESKNYVNIRKITSKLSLQRRYDIVNHLISIGKLHGILLHERLLFLSITKDKLSAIKNDLKNNGRIEISVLKGIWKVKDEIIINILNHFEKGIEGKKTYYTLTHISNILTSNLSNIDEYNLNLTSENLEIDLNLLLRIVQEMINEGELAGVIKNQTIFLSFENFESIISDYIDEKMDDAFELSFNEISRDLFVQETDIEKFLMYLVEKNPGKFAVYPLEEKIQFKR